MKAFSGAQGDNASTEDMLKNIDDEGLNAIKTLIQKTLTKSLPDEPQSDRDEFGMKYMMTLLPKIMEINMQQEESKGSEIGRKLEAIRKAKLNK